jgi:hypothetical protein
VSEFDGKASIMRALAHYGLLRHGKLQEIDVGAHSNIFWHLPNYFQEKFHKTNFLFFFLGKPSFTLLFFLKIFLLG